MTESNDNFWRFLNENKIKITIDCIVLKLDPEWLRPVVLDEMVVRE